MVREGEGGRKERLYWLYRLCYTDCNVTRTCTSVLSFQRFWILLYTTLCDIWDRRKCPEFRGVLIEIHNNNCNGLIVFFHVAMVCISRHTVSIETNTSSFFLQE